MHIVLALIIFGFVILIHELGHFLVAKRVGMKVEVFSLGFGPKLIGFHRGETEYRITWMPLIGGYVKIAGMELEEKLKEDAPPPSEQDFYARPVWQRNLVCLAGPFLTFILAIVLYVVVFVIGENIPVSVSLPIIGEVKENSPAAGAGLQPGDKIVTINNNPVAGWDDIQREIILGAGEIVQFEFQRNGERIIKEVKPEKDADTGLYLTGISPSLDAPYLGNILPGYPAEKAGLKTGDRVKEINKMSIDNWGEMVKIVSKSAGIELEFLIERDGQESRVRMTPVYEPERECGIIGVNAFITRSYPFPSALKKSFQESARGFTLFVHTVKLLVTRRVSPTNLAGPIGIVKLATEAARYGVITLLNLTAIICVQLTIINLLPIPIIDGGHILFHLIESVRGKPVSVRKQIFIHRVVITCLVTFFLYVSYNDVKLRLLGGKFLP